MQNFKKKARVFFWLVKGFLLKHKVIFLFTIIIGFFSFYLLTFILSRLTPADYKKITTSGWIGNYTISSLPLEIQNEISMGLTKITDKKEASSAASISWEATDSGKKYIFRLRNDLLWQDGTKLTAYDINYKLKDIEILLTSAHTIEFLLKDSFSPLPAILSQPLFKKKLIGLGDFRVKSINYSGKFIKKLILENHTEKKVYKFYSNNDALLSAYKLGEIEVAKNLTDISSSRKDATTKIEQYDNTDKPVVIFFNLKEKLYQDKNLRLALSLSLPNEFNTFATASSSINPISWAFNRNVKKPAFNLETAKKLLAKTTESTSSGIAFRKSKIILSTMRQYQDTALKIAASWKELGVETEIKLEDFLPTHFEVLLAGLETPNDPDQYAFWHSTQPTNITGLQSPKIDKLLEDGRKIIEKDKRLQKYLDFQKALLDEIPAVFLYYPVTYTLTRI